MDEPKTKETAAAGPTVYVLFVQARLASWLGFGVPEAISAHRTAEGAQAFQEAEMEGGRVMPDGKVVGFTFVAPVVLEGDPQYGDLGLVYLVHRQDRTRWGGYEAPRLVSAHRRADDAQRVRSEQEKGVPLQHGRFFPVAHVQPMELDD
ncbi:hypothetical protein [Streptomyces albogriseolus]|uniref:hypothetical protein n=1 Tax=Streptomyces albogriseolus TaxID=1887 RepID=UPI0034613E98